MRKCNDPAYEAFRDRNQAGVIEKFMESEREKALQTGTNERF